jgi:flagellar biosynthetic protein FliR
VFNPGFDASIPLLSQLLYLIAVAIYVAIGGHRLLMAALLDTFVAMPAGQAALSTSVVEPLVTLLEQSFSLGIRVAAPAMVALLLATLVLGLISRTLPQLNLMAMGFGLNSMIGLGMLSVSLGGMAWVFQDEVTPALETVLRILPEAAAVSPEPRTLGSRPFLP